MLKRKYLIVLFTLLMLFSLLKADEVKEQNFRTFIREYTYNASEHDSKVTSRSKALESVKLILLQEIGVYIESWINIKDEEINYVTNEFFKQEIKTVTAGITETKILDEEWNGTVYFIRASITIDTNDVIKKINYALENNLKNKEIEKLKSLLSSQEIENKQNFNEIEQLKGQLKDQQIKKNEAEKQLDILKKQLTDLQNKNKSMQAEAERVKSLSDQIMADINKKTQTARTNIRLYMNKQEVIKVAGEPREKAYYDSYWNYGKVWVYFDSNIVKSVFRDDGKFSPYSGNSSEYRNRNIASD